MVDLVSLPLPLEALPESVRRFCDPASPGPMRTMAAKGLVPVKGGELVTMLVQLASDREAAIQQAAADSLQKLPDAVILPLCSSDLSPAVLDGLATHFRARPEVLEPLIANPTTSDVTVERIAKTAPERLCERIATNEQRLLSAPLIIEALYKNPATRMSTADRLVELAARNNVDLPGIPCFRDHVEALRGELIMEPTDEPLPSDELFAETIAEDRALAAGADAREVTDETMEAATPDGGAPPASIGKKFVPLHARIGKMKKSEKIRLAMVGDAAARALLVRDHNKTVAAAAVQSPRMTDADAVNVAKSRQVSEDVLRYVGKKRDFVANYEVKKALVFNPKTPLSISMNLITYLRDDEVKVIAKGKGIPQAMKSAAMQILKKREKKGS